MVQKGLAPDNFSTEFREQIVFKFFTHIMVDRVGEPETGDKVSSAVVLQIYFR